MRCISCNGIIDVLVDHPIYENDTDDMCSSCRTLAYVEWSYVDDHEHMFENAHEGVTNVLTTEN